MEVFEGSTSDPKTVACQVDKIRTRFGLQRVVLVGDRGMLTAARIREDLQGIDGLRWITTLRAPTIRKLLAAGTVTPSLFDERDLAEVSSEQFPGERLIVCRNPLLAAERQRKRQELLAATEKDLTPITAATRRKSQPLCGAAAIGMRVGKVINRHKVAKHFVTRTATGRCVPGNVEARATTRYGSYGSKHSPRRHQAAEPREQRLGISPGAAVSRRFAAALQRGRCGAPLTRSAAEGRIRRGRRGRRRATSWRTGRAGRGCVGGRCVQRWRAPAGCRRPCGCGCRRTPCG